MRGTKVAVTGAAGQVGSVLVRHLCGEGMDVVAICRNTISAGLIHFSCQDCDIRIGSITKKDEASRLLGDCDIVINCALAEGGGSPKNAYLLNRQIIDGLLSSESLRLLIHFSSISVYGDFITDSRSTFMRPRPDNEYGRSKLYVEKYAKRMLDSRGIKYYIIRLGHVIGAGIGRSREIIEFSKSSWFRLPFDGALPSNTIHVERLASLIYSLIDSQVPQGVYNVADKERTWRMVFDWHTNCLGLPAVQAMPLLMSRKMRSLYSQRSAFHDIVRWCRSLPLRDLLRSPAVFDLALRILVKAPESLTRRLANISRRTGAARQIAPLVENHPVLNPVYLSDAMPERYLSMPNKENPLNGSEEDLCRDLKKWYEKFSKPKFLTES